MLRLLYRNQPSRSLSAFVCLCYAFLSLALPFQHQHQGEDAQLLVGRYHSSSTRQAQIPVQTQLVARAKIAAPTHCVACEWQAMNVSAALPALKFDFSPPVSSRVVTTLPRNLRSRAFPTSSRGPPLV